ncbi:MAG: MFS transporter [Haloferacaceae archaeon]
MADAATTRRELFTDPRLVSVLSVTGVAVFSNQAAPVALPGISRSLAVSDAQVGLVMTAFFLPASVMLLIVGSLADIYGRRTVVLPSLLVSGAAGVGIFFVDSFAALLALRVLQGAAFPALTPLSTAIIGDLYEGPTGATAQGLRSSVNGLSGVLGPAFAGVLAGVAWQYPFLLSALVFPVALVVYRYLPETGGHAAGERPGLLAHLRDIGTEFVDSDLRLLAVGGGVIYFAKFAVVTFIPLFAVRELGASAFAAGLLLSVRGLVRIFSAPLSGVAVERFARRGALVGTLLLVAATVVLMPLAPAAVPGVPPLVVLGLLVGAYSAGEALFNPVLNDTVVGLASDDRRAGVVNTISVFKNGASAVSPAVLGLVLTATDFGALFLLAAVVPVAYAALLLVRFDGGEAASTTG